MPYFDLEQNFPHIYRQLQVNYYEGLESYRVPSSITWANKHSRTSVKRTQKKQASQRKMHLLERDLSKILPDKDKILVLRFLIGDKYSGYIAETNIGQIGVIPDGNRWVAYAINARYELIAGAESNKSYQDALARLCGQQWASHKFSDDKLSLYDMYQDVFFDFNDHNIRKPRNNTLKLRVNSVLAPIWR